MESYVQRAVSDSQLTYRIRLTMNAGDEETSGVDHQKDAAA